MSKRIVITAEQVQEAAHAGRLIVPQGALATPVARGVAAELGVVLDQGTSATSPPVVDAPQPAQKLIAEGSGDDLTKRVRALVTALLAEKTPVAHKVKLCRASDAVTEPFPYPGPKPTQQVRTGDVVTSEDGSPMAAGYMTLTAGEFPWTFSYDEIQIVLEGELHIGTPEGVRIAKPGDVMYIPKGSEITFGTPSWTRFVYVTFPADWEQGL